MVTMQSASRVGNGTHTYEVQEGWMKLPDSVTPGYTHGIEVDGQGNVYLFHTGRPSIVKFDGDGTFIKAFGEQFEGGAHGFYLHKEGQDEFLYVTDTSRSLVVKLTLDGETVFTLDAPAPEGVYDEERKYVPTDVAVAPNGDIYTADGYGQSYIHQYDRDGRYIRSWGGKGTEPGQLNCPHGISVDLRSGEPELYVADRGNHRIQVFGLDGTPKRVLVDDMDMPCSFYFHGTEVYVPDLDSRVSVYDANDRLIVHLGEDQQAYKQQGWPNLPKSYYRPNKFSSPHGVCVDKDGNVYVAEWVHDGRVTKLIRQ